MAEQEFILSKPTKKQRRAMVGVMGDKKLTVRPYKVKPGIRDILDPTGWSEYPSLYRVIPPGGNRWNTSIIPWLPLVVLGGWIFDSRCGKAKPLTAANLREYCAVGGENHMEVHDGYVFCESGKTRKVEPSLYEVTPLELQPLLGGHHK